MVTKIYVVAHKDFLLPTNDSIYIPIMVGNKYTHIPENGVSDNTGENISEKNDMYNELTALYWIWKNSDADIVGLCHYRRYFTTTKGKVGNLLFRLKKGFITEEQIKKMLSKNELIVHNKTMISNGNLRQLEKVAGAGYEVNNNKLDREIIELAIRVFRKVYPNDYGVFCAAMNGKISHLLNVMVGRKEDVDKYCSWLFPYLFELEKELLKHYKREELSRAIGLIAERMIDVWLLKNNVSYRECFTINTERVDWKMWG